MYGPQSPPHGGPTQPAATHGAQVPGQAQGATQYSGGQNQTGSNGPPPQQPGRDNRALLTEQEESYADPPRAWKRAGSLLGSWAVVWASILIAGLVFEGLVDASPETITHEDPGTPHNAAKEYMRFVFEDESLEDSEGLECDEITGLSSKDLISSFKEWKTDKGSEPSVVVSRANDEAGAQEDPNTIVVRIELEVEQVFDQLYYDVTVEPTGSTFCISNVSENTTVE